MYKYTTASYKEIASDVTTYADHIYFRAMGQMPSKVESIGLADSNRQLWHYIKMFRNHSERDDHDTALIMLALVRNRLYKYVADALRADVDFHITECARLLNYIEEYAHTVQVKISTEE